MRLKFIKRKEEQELLDEIHEEYVRMMEIEALIAEQERKAEANAASQEQSEG